MRSIESVPAHERFLMVPCRISPQRWQNEVDKTSSFLRSSAAAYSEQERQHMLSLIEQPLTSAELPLVVVHGYADTPEQMSWDWVFAISDTGRAAPTLAIHKFSMILQRLVIRSISHGWHQSVVIHFPNGIPSLLQNLPEDKVDHDEYAALCCSQDFSEIQRLWNVDST